MSGMWDRTLVYLGLREEPEETYDDLPDEAIARFDADEDPHAAHAPPRPGDQRRPRRETDRASERPDRRDADEPRQRAERAGREGVDRSSATAASSSTGREPHAQSSRPRHEAGRNGSDPGSDREARDVVVRPGRRDEATSRRSAADHTADEARPVRVARDPEPSNVTRFPTREVSVVPGGQEPAARLRRVELARFEDVEQVGRRFRSRQPVLLDLVAADGPTARRILDVVAGFVFALDGKLTKVDKRTFLLVPRGVVLQDDDQERVQHLTQQADTGAAP